MNKKDNSFIYNRAFKSNNSNGEKSLTKRNSKSNVLDKGFFMDQSSKSNKAQKQSFQEKSLQIEEKVDKISSMNKIMENNTNYKIPSKNLMDDCVCCKKK